MLQQLLSVGLCCSILVHALVIFAFCCSISFPFLQNVSYEKSNTEAITLVSLASFEQSISTEAPKIETSETSEKTIQEKNEIEKSPEKTIAEPEIKKEYPTMLAEQKQTPKKAALTPEQKKIYARMQLMKSWPSLTKTMTRNDFFGHARAVAQQTSPTIKSNNVGNFSAKISGLKDLQFHSYEEKVRSALINAFNIIKHKTPLLEHPKNSQPGYTLVKIVINKDGSIAQLFLQHSSGDKQYDEMILKAIRYADFPAIPNHLNIEKYQLSDSFHTHFYTF